MSQRQPVHRAQDSLETLDDAQLGLRVSFSQQTRHIGHSITLLDRAREYPLLISHEGNSRQAFPPSPALQQLAIEQQANGSLAALLIGMADRNHWSVSIQSSTQDNSLLVDVACRCQTSEASFLGSTYRLPGQLTTCRSGYLIQTDRNQPCCHIMPAGNSARISARFAPGDSKLIIQPQWDASTQTQRWCYRLQALPANPTWHTTETSKISQR